MEELLRNLLAVSAGLPAATLGIGAGLVGAALGAGLALGRRATGHATHGVISGSVEYAVEGQRLRYADVQAARVAQGEAWRAWWQAETSRLAAANDALRVQLEHERVKSERSEAATAEAGRLRADLERLQCETALAAQRLRAEERDRERVHEREMKRLEIVQLRAQTEADDVHATNDNERLSILAEAGHLDNVYPIRRGMQWWEDTAKSPSGR